MAKLRNDLHFVTGNGIGRKRKSGAEKFFVRGRIKKFLDDSGVGNRGGGGGSFLRRMKRDLYTADGERFRERSFY